MHIITALVFVLSIVHAWDAPAYSGYKLVWQSGMSGPAHSLPSTRTWHIVTGSHNDNNELQTYASRRANLRLSAHNTLQIIPRRDRTAIRGWTSARIESKYVFTPQPGRVTRIEASLRLGSNLSRNKQGIWPAFWLMGDSYRNGVAWPGCGEIDVMENINGQSIGNGGVHCDKYPNGVCNEPVGLASTTPLYDDDFHTWRIEVDRRSSDFTKQTITWLKDGKKFHSISGGVINNSRVWATLAQSPLYIILNVAVGGNWPGYPDANTYDGLGSMMEIGYVAHYVTRYSDY